MNIPVLIVAIIMLIAVVAHLFGGTKETAAIKPGGADKKLTAQWVQAMCAFQMLTVDLLAVMIGLFAIFFYDFGSIEQSITLLLSLLFFLWGVAWVVQMLWLKKSGVTLLRLPHWVIWFLCSGLLYFGA